MRLQQGFANDEMGFALQKSSSAHVSYGSIADNVDNPNRVVRYEAKSSEPFRVAENLEAECPLWVKSRLMHRNKSF
jgi:hypothetical protein